MEPTTCTVKADSQFPDPNAKRARMPRREPKKKGTKKIKSYTAYHRVQRKKN